MIEIQNITIEHTSRGVKQEWIYDHIIYPRFFISRVTYYAYLRHNAKAELKKIQTEKERQLSFFA